MRFTTRSAAVAVGNSKVKFCVRFNKILGYQYLFETGEYCNGLHPVSFDLVLYKHALNILLNRSATCSLALVAEWENIKAFWASLYQSPQNLCHRMIIIQEMCVLHLYRTVSKMDAIRNTWSTFGYAFVRLRLVWQNAKQGILKFVKCLKRPATFKQTECFMFFTRAYAIMLSATPNTRATVVNFLSLTM